MDRFKQSITDDPNHRTPSCLELKAVMEQDKTVKRCVATDLSPLGWFYLVETTHSFPRFVVGEYRPDRSIRWLLKCGMEHTARKFWDLLINQSEADAMAYANAETGR